MTTTIAVLNEKGGTGKSMISQNLAALANQRGKRTLLRDADVQGTSRDWYRVRREGSKLRGLRVEYAPAPADWRIDKFQEASEGCDLVVCDGPHSLGPLTIVTALLADIVLIPARPQHADLWSLEHTVKQMGNVAEAREARGRAAPRVLVVLNEARPREREFASTCAAIGEMGLELLPCFLTHRVAYDRARGRGEAVVTMGDDVARAEIAALYDAVFGALS